MKAFFKRNENELTLIIALFVAVTFITLAVVSMNIFLYMLAGILVLTTAAFIYVTLVRPLQIIYSREKKLRLEKE